MLLRRREAGALEDGGGESLIGASVSNWLEKGGEAGLSLGL
jgi:hypothetical protein